MHHRNERKQAREAKHFTALVKVVSGDEAAKSTDPNSCATCKYKHTETAAEWCYMFREQPEPVCMQHRERMPDFRRLAAMFAGDDDSLVAVQSEGGKP